MANGNFAGGDGTANDPYLIEDAFDLDAMRNNLSAHYELISDIDLDISPFNEGEGWEPIGKNSPSSERFTGTFNGNGYVIKSLFFNRPSTNQQGLFSSIRGAEIKNVGLEDVNITGSGDIGGLVGRAYSSTIKNSYLTGEVIGNSNTGGLVGYATSSSTIKNSYSTGNAIGNGNSIGGLVGWANQSSTIKNSYSIGSVSGNNRVGGLVGLANTITIINSFWDKDTSGQNSSTGGGTRLPTAEMQNPQTFIDAGWDQELNDEGNSLWLFGINQYPKLDLSIQRILFLSEDNNNPKKVDTDNKRIIELPNQSKETFLRHGMLSPVMNLDTVFTEKQYIKDEFTTLGSGRVFKQNLDVNKIIKKISVE